AMDELVDLGEEFDLANAAAAALEVEAGADFLPFRKMIADPPGDRLDLADRAEIGGPAPDERMNGVEEIAAKRGVAGGESGADERRPLPGQSRAFVMRDGGADRQHD